MNMKASVVMWEESKGFPFQHYTAKEIKPRGWLKRQLQIQAEGLAGNLDKMWPDVRDSKWIGGDKEGWERVPYWLDGFIPLAYLLDDQDMKDRAQRYIDAILAQQKPDGWICPCEEEERVGYDVWAVFLICKVLVVYYECTSDPRIEPAVKGALWNLHQWLYRHTLFNWAAARWYECMISINWLYDRTGEAWLPELAHTLSIHGMNYQTLADNFMYKSFRREWKHTAHVVNLAMALKAYAVSGKFLDIDGGAFAEKYLSVLQKYHGTAYGLFTGDECLAGTAPTQGTELCAIVEAMYSYEVLFETTGDQKWLDRLEKLAFNALPATISEDMWTHQYVQLVNQISCRIQDLGREPSFTTNNHEAHIFGLEPNFGCCTANMGQGFPKFALSTYYHNDRGIYVAAIAPASLHTQVNGVDVQVLCDTAYPFEDTVRYQVRCEMPVEFSLFLRVPETAERAWIEGQEVCPGEFCELRRIWDEQQIVLTLQTRAKLTQRPNGLYVAEKGNLLFSLPISYRVTMHEYEKNGVVRKFPYCDYEFTPTSSWNYGFVSGEFTCEQNPDFGNAFSVTKPPLVLKARMAKVEWEYQADYPDLCQPLPKEGGKIGEAEEIELYPYGCTNLRMTEMPFLNKD